MLQRFIYLFPLWAILLSALAYFFPQWFIPAKSAIIPLLSLIMFGMGMTLTFADFRQVLSKPLLILLGVFLQYALMPLIAYLLAILFRFPAELMVGMLLVGASSGGTASNVICYLARANVALSITLTLVSTLLAIVMLPWLTWQYIGQQVTVPVWQMVENIATMVLVPVLLGVTLNSVFGRRLKQVQMVFPLISVLAIIVIIAIIVALNHDRLQNVGSMIVIAVILHNLSGLGLGYFIARLFGQDIKTARTLAIEVGMQNSGLSVALAIKHFTALAALPGAVFSIWHNISGALLATWWHKR